MAIHAGNISGSSTSTGSFGTVESTTAKIPTLLGDVSIGGEVTLLADEIQGSYNPNRLRFPGTQQAELNDVFRVNSSSGRGTLGLYGSNARSGGNTLFNFNFNSVTNKFTADHGSVTYKNFYINADAIIGFPGSSGPSQAQDISIFKSNIVTEADHGPGRRLFLDFRHDDVDMFTADMSGSLYAFGNISGSATSTGSFGAGYIDNKLGIGITPASTLHVQDTNATFKVSGSAAANSYIEYNTSGEFVYYRGGFNKFSIGNSATTAEVLSTSQVLLGGSNAVQFDETSKAFVITQNDGGMVETFNLDKYGKLVLPRANGGVSGSSTSTGSFGRVEVATIAGTLSTAAQTNITSLGTITTFRSTGIDDNANALAITINSDEYVGIGTTNPTRALDVVGDIKATGDIIAERFVVSSSVSHFTQSFSSGSTIFGDTIDDTHRFTGSLHMGTGSIDTVLHITASGNIVAHQLQQVRLVRVIMVIF